ncbi:hypothetical protein PARMER_03488 [Parabacteroides merdae ATCC 43184]|nr:hypothetical protein PARMER_03488 [Parabacteroides merdae ATCC 43184]
MIKCFLTFKILYTLLYIFLMIRNLWFSATLFGICLF